MLEFDGVYSATHRKAKFDICAKMLQKVSCKIFCKKAYFNFVKFSIIFCRRFSEETHFYF